MRHKALAGHIRTGNLPFCGQVLLSKIPRSIAVPQSPTSDFVSRKRISKIFFDDFIECRFDRLALLHEFGDLVRMLGNRRRQALAVVSKIFVALCGKLIVQLYCCRATAASGASNTYVPGLHARPDANAGDSGLDLFQSNEAGGIWTGEVAFLRVHQVMVPVKGHLLAEGVHDLVTGLGTAAGQGKLHAVAIVNHLFHDAFQILYRKAIEIAVPALASCRDQSLTFRNERDTGKTYSTGGHGNVEPGRALSSN